MMRSLLPRLAVLVLLSAVLVGPAPEAGADTACAPGPSQVACENQLPGVPQDEWDVGEGDTDITGFTTDVSVNVGGTVHFKVDTPSPTFTIQVYRLGWYQGNGARRIATISHVARHNQPACLNDAATGLIDCGNWSETGSWAVPSTAVSGVYFAVLSRDDNPLNRSMIPFVVRNDASHAALTFQTSDTTWQAYNNWGGNSLYTGSPVGRAYKVSFNRPYNTRGGTPSGRDFLFSAEYPMIRFLERNGYDLSYQSGVDTDRYGSLLVNHGTFLSVGHDEYWSGNQRAEVEAARDAGVNLAFFSGNEVYWKTRYETSIDGSGTAYRTLVTYKETRDNARTDPTGTWTGTWRDPRFSPPADGGRPENALTGTIFTANCCNASIVVPSADGKMRLWRGTGIESLAPGTSATLADNTLGYEFDETLENGFQPAGLVPLSTTVQDTPEYLYDYGTSLQPGTATHHLALHRAASGALVFSAGTVQWSWGLDDQHDGVQGAVDPRMQQATVNLLADLGATPASLQAGLTAPTASTDHTAPVAAITAPANGATVEGGGVVTVTGTAADTGGGVVGAVEVSTDGGTSWHRATGRAAWSYDWTPNGLTPATILARATDDSGNLQPTPTSISVNQTCPCSLFGGREPGLQLPSTDASALTLGVKFRSDRDAFVTGVRFWKESANLGTHTGSLFSSSGTRLATGTFASETATGWQTLTFANPVPVSAGTTYVAAYYAPQGHYTATSSFFAAATTAGPLTAPASTSVGGNGVFAYGGDTFPSGSYNAANYWVDVLLRTSLPDDHTPATITPASPSPGATDVHVDAAPTASVDEPIQTSGLSFTLTPAGGGSIAGTVVYDGVTRTISFTPSAPLAADTTYTAVVAGVVDLAGNASSPRSWSFTTTAAATSCPCMLLGAATPQTAAANDSSAVTLGVKFRTDRNGFVSGVRFAKGAGNTGTHTGSLWSSSGTRLATGTFTGETASGWQTLTFSSPVAVQAGTTYVASYFAPNGHYAVDPAGFASAHDSGPLHVPASSTVGGNGVYRYGADAFPTDSYNASNYWIDAIFVDQSASLAVTDVVPPNGSTNRPVGSTASVTFNNGVQPASIDFTLTSTGGTAVAGTVTYDSPSATATFTPTANLAAGTTYTARVAHATDLPGNQLAAPAVWSFTTTSDSSGCPCTLFGSTTPAITSANDSSAVALGSRFSSDADGWITEVRFFKGAGNGGTHTGSIWSASGQRLATGTFTSESASGWQTMALTTPLAITAGTPYVVSYFAPQGHYAATGGFYNTAHDVAPLHQPATSGPAGNGLYLYGSDGFPTGTWNATDYGVDVTFVRQAPSDTTPPTAHVTTPAAGATAVATSASVAAQLDEPVTPSSVHVTVTPAGGSAVAGTLAYDAPSRIATFTPAAPLAAGTTYTAQLSGATDLAGNVMTAPLTWTFTTSSSSSGCPCSLFGTTGPSGGPANDPAAVTLGTKFSVDVPGAVTGVRFHKGTGNDGTHTGSLWSIDGTRLATGTFTGETSSGWQTLVFAAPVTVTPGTTYVVSYFAPQGRYSASGSFFASGVDNAPLHAPSNGAGGGNGVYRYGTDGFPTGNWNATNYWVDPLFLPS